MVSRKCFNNVFLIPHVLLFSSIVGMNPVPDEVNFVDYHYVGTHNSHVYKRFFTTTYQHETDITDQLNNGIRGFMLDVYPWEEGRLNPDMGIFTIRTNRVYGNDGNVVLSHATPGVAAFSQKGFTGWDGILAIVEYQTYAYELEKIVNFLKENPREVVVVHVENYVGALALSQATQVVVDRLKYNPVFRPSDWNVKQAKPDVWPTLGWMRKNNKRLLITTDGVQGSVLTNTGLIWDCRNFRSNGWGNINTCSDPRPIGCNPEAMCSPYHAMVDATVSFFNHFRSDAVVWALWDVRRDSQYDVLLDAFKKCSAKKLFDGRIPNGIFTDRTVESIRSLKTDGIKTVLDLVNEWNAAAAAAVRFK